MLYKEKIENWFVSAANKDYFGVNPQLFYQQTDKKNKLVK